jgi:hypothetical protein
MRMPSFNTSRLMMPLSKFFHALFSCKTTQQP